jgi:hypothetical protein
MTGTTTGIVIICVVVVVALAVWLGLVARAARRPGGKNKGGQPTRGLVQGGEHVGDGRSVMPHRDAEVPQDGGTPPPPEETAESAASARRTEHRSVSPMDL